MNSCLYKGYVDHTRVRPRRHKLRYRVFSLLLDLDDLAQIDANSRLLTVNRRGPLSFWESDHGDGAPLGLKSWVLNHLKTAGFETEGVAVRALCYPRIFGYVFNPLTVYFCYDSGGRLFATLHEVQNTFGEKHTYVLPARLDEDGKIRQVSVKYMYVSPFTEMDGTYKFELTGPEEKIRVVIGLHDRQGPVLNALFEGRRQALSDRALFLTFFQYPLMTAKVTVGIHLEALRLWLKKVPLVRREPAHAPITTSYPKPDVPAHTPD